ncbi:MAG: ATP-binding cassette domain-containing protein [Sphingopyxis sp.]
MRFDVRVTRQLGGATIRAAFTADSGLTALFGPSGVGKTSILNMVAGLLVPDEGRIMVGETLLFDSAAGVNMPAHHRRAGYIFQDVRLFPHRRVRDNLVYGARRAAGGAGLMTMAETVDFLGIAHLLDRWPRTLSGGETQRVAIGRALLSGPDFLLMDEPLTGLDPARRAEVLAVIERLRDQAKLPILYVSHDRAEVERLATRIIPL